MPELKNHYINIGEHGRYDSGGDVQSTFADADRIIQMIKISGQKKVTLYFHGGLNSEKTGIKTAKKMLEVYKHDQGNYPITFIWETGFFETIRDNISEISDVKLVKKIVRIILRVLSKKLGIKGAKGAGKSLSYIDIENQLSQEDPFETFDLQLQQSPGARGGFDIPADDQDLITELTSECLTELEADPEMEQILEAESDVTLLQKSGKARGVGLFGTAKLIGVVGYRVIKRFMNDRDHGLYPTIIEEVIRELYLDDLGAWVWGQMKERAEEMWMDNTGLDQDKIKGGTDFIEKLFALRQSIPDLQIDLVGHSAGSIVVCFLIKAVSDRHVGGKFHNINFMAPACTSKLFFDNVYSRQDLFDNFRIFTMKDELEIQDRLVRYVYTRSLLYFISGVLEPDEVDIPLLGLEKQNTGNVPYDKDYLVTLSRYLLQAGSSRLVLSKTPSGAELGKQTEAITHGGFDDDPATRRSLVHIAGG